MVFNEARNLVRDQGVGGSNPLSPTNLFKHINNVWETLKNSLTASAFPKFVGDLRFLQILVNPFGNGTHECKVAKRKIQVDCPQDQVEPGPGFDFQSFICSKQDVRIFIPFPCSAGSPFSEAC